MGELNQLLSILEGASFNRVGDDHRLWSADPSKSFSVKSFLASLCSINNPTPVPWFKLIWKVPVPRKVQVFMWLAVLGKVPTCDSLQKRLSNIFLSPNWVFGDIGCYWVPPLGISDLLQIDVGRPLSKRCKILWRIIVPAVMWSIWLERNMRIFNDCQESMEEVWGRIKYRASLWASSHKLFKSYSLSDLVRSWCFVS
ncbi:hypothetical protein ACS0TY_000083 [Phlomoides rotata]